MLFVGMGQRTGMIGATNQARRDADMEGQITIFPMLLQLERTVAAVALYQITEMEIKPVSLDK